jgi:hypothetical protein
MHFGRSHEYQFPAVSARAMMRDLVRVASSLPVEAMTALKHIRNL